MTSRKTKLDTVPVFDMNDFEKDKEKFAREFGQAFHDYGFVRIKNHGISEDTIEAAEDVIRRFFQMDDNVKEKYSRPEEQFQVGFTKNNEKANGQTKADLKEYFMICRDKKRDPDAKTPETPAIDELPKFQEKTHKLYYELASMDQ